MVEHNVRIKRKPAVKRRYGVIALTAIIGVGALTSAALAIGPTPTDGIWFVLGLLATELLVPLHERVSEAPMVLTAGCINTSTSWPYVWVNPEECA